MTRADGPDELVFGDLRIRAEGLQSGEDGAAAFRIAITSIETISIVVDSASEDLLRQLFWGLAYAAIGGGMLYAGSGVARWAVGIPGVLLGGFVLRHVFRRVTLLRLRANGAPGELPLGRRLSREETDRLAERLRAWGYPLR